MKDMSDKTSQSLTNSLSLLPTRGTKFYQLDSAWQQLYAEDFTKAEKEKRIHRTRFENLLAQVRKALKTEPSDQQPTNPSKHEE